LVFVKPKQIRDCVVALVFDFLQVMEYVWRKVRLVLWCRRGRRRRVGIE
jgi:hypothetical protein